jgi:exopolysaccharide biosynthesis polyprenyl glycosylphosphotransferase
VVGANPLGQDVARALAGQRRVVGYVDNGADLDVAGAGDLPLLGPIAQLDDVVHTYGVDEIVIALPADRREQINRVIAGGFRRAVRVKCAPDLPDPAALPARYELHQIGGRAYVGFDPVARVSALKRVVDVALSLAAVLVLAPVLLAIAIAVRLDSPGPIFYRQERVGKNGRRFWMFKFRSMAQDADRRLADLRAHNEATGPLFKMRHDPRVTRVGRVLRRLSLDELPQLFNVLKGEMSLVGPRPPIPSEVAEYEDWQHGRLRATPGITGLWQVSGRSEVPFHDMVRLDLHYIRNWSLWLDLEILIKTIPAVLTNKGAY